MKCIGLFFCKAWANLGRWRDADDAVSPGFPPFASDDLDLLPCGISLDFRSAVLIAASNASAQALRTIIFFFLESASALPHWGPGRSIRYQLSEKKGSSES